jgi:TolB-like protein/class 3 adenylate cyclase/cytochrome c-type biogenesis protein CcmH/NrfG
LEVPLAEEGFKRKLAAILSADVEGYSRLMDDDEEATVRTLTAYRTAINDLVQQYRGRVVDTPGDNILAEFTSVVDAVNCAVEIQRELAEKNAELPHNRKMEFRIGVNLGDVIEEEGRIYGDGVNIAARVEAMSQAGGICISGRAYDQVANKLGLEYENLGEHQVKNITTPIRVFRIWSFPGAAAHRVVQAKKTLRRKWRKIAFAIVAVLVVAITVATIWNFYLRPPSVEVASVERMAHPLPDKPSIAVLPFVNMSGDPEQEYFSDGMTEDLITDLSQISGLFVIGRNSTFAYKGKTIKIRQVAEELGVQYVLEGSVRKADNRVRVNAQLIDATTGHHLWAKRYDGNLDDIFDLQDKINQKIVSALAVKLTVGEQEQLARKETDNIEVYDNFLQGLEYYRRNTPDDWTKAVSYLETAIKLDPNYGRAYALLARIYDQASVEYLFGLVSETNWAFALGVSYEEAQELAEKYLQMAFNNPTPLYHWLASRVNLDNHKYEAAIADAERALALEPNNPEILVQMARVLVFAAIPEEAVEFTKRAMRIDPNYRDPDYFWVSGMAYFAMGKLEEALTFFEKAHRRNPKERWYLYPLAATYAHLGRGQEARDAITKYTKGTDRPIALATYILYLPFKDQEITNRIADGLRKAGME